MDAAGLMEGLWNLIDDHWTKLAGGTAALFLGRWWGRHKAEREWRRRQFMDRLMFSLSSIYRDEDGVPTLAIRTLFETHLKEVFLNEAAVKKVLRAAAATTEDEPVVRLEKDDRWHQLKAVLNALAERYSLGTLAYDMGLEVASRTYVVCLTREIAERVRSRKIRAMVVRKDQLLSGAFETRLNFEADSHSVRVETLRRMRQLYSADPDLFVDLVISLPAATGMRPDVSSSEAEADCAPALSTYG